MNFTTRGTAYTSNCIRRARTSANKTTVNFFLSSHTADARDCRRDINLVTTATNNYVQSKNDNRPYNALVVKLNGVPLAYPNVLQTTVASLTPKVELQTVSHRPVTFKYISSTPSLRCREPVNLMLDVTGASKKEKLMQILYCVYFQSN